MRRLLLLAPLTLAATGCLRDADPIDIDPNPVLVHAVLEAGADSATVLLSRPERDANSYRPISGAEVRLTGAGETVLLTERTDGAACAVVGRTPVGDGSGCYSAALAAPIETGASYALEVVLPTGGRVTGETVIPAPVEITGPAAGTTYEIECPDGAVECRSRWSDEPPFHYVPLALITVEWTPPPGAARVDALFHPTRVVKDGTTYPGERCHVEPATIYQPVPAPRGTARWPVYSIYCSGPLDVLGWDTIYMDATIVAYDSAYARYVDAVFDRDAARIGTVTGGLDGALGVFGAVNPRALEVALVRTDPPGAAALRAPADRN